MDPNKPNEPKPPDVITQHLASNLGELCELVYEVMRCRRPGETLRVALLRQQRENATEGATLRELKARTEEVETVLRHLVREVHKLTNRKLVLSEPVKPAAPKRRPRRATKKRRRAR